MLGKTSKPVIGILTGSLLSGSRAAGAADAATSPRSPTESKNQSPRGLKSFDFGGVGLGIVAALENSAGGHHRNEIPALFGRNLSRSSPVPVSSPKYTSRNRQISEETDAEEYTIVTCRNGHTKVYSDAAAVGGRKGDDRTPFRIQTAVTTSRASVFHISPARYGDADGIPPSDFLSSCNLCRKKLVGKDIYMYRGEKAFCSTECRYRQMVADERKEKCSSDASWPAATAAVEVAGSPYAGGAMFTTGILAI